MTCQPLKNLYQKEKKLNQGAPAHEESDRAYTRTSGALPKKAGASPILSVLDWIQKVAHFAHAAK
jgi:hypothetical protein